MTKPASSTSELPAISVRAAATRPPVQLSATATRAADRGYAISHLDVTLICESPKVGPHAGAMRAAVAAAAGIAPDRVSVKATTTERLGFTGRGEGIAAQAVATVRVAEEI